jgi:hypothetical protein
MQGNFEVSGGLNSSFAAAAQSSPGADEAHRSGYVSAYGWGGACRCPQLSDHGAVGEFHHRMHDRLRMHQDVNPRLGISKSQRASMTSSPLFIKVAESIVIR